MKHLRTVAAIGLAASALALARAAVGDALPADPFQRCATKALRGDYGKLKNWQRAAYKRGLDAGVTADHRFVVTAYLGTEGRSGRIDSRGNRCTMRTAASNRVKRGSYVWTPRWGIRQVLDCGAKSNDRKADRMGCDSWLDLWFPNGRAARRVGCDGWTPTTGAVIP